MSLLRRTAEHDGAMLLTSADDVRAAGTMARLRPALVLIRITRLPGGERRRYVELTNAGRDAVKESMAHA